MAISSINTNNINPYAGYGVQGANVNAFQASSNFKVKPEQNGYAPKTLSIEDYELADRIASASLFAPDKIKTRPTSYQGRVDNPFAETVNAWSQNGGAPVNNGDGFYDGQQGSIFDQKA